MNSHNINSPACSRTLGKGACQGVGWGAATRPVWAVRTEPWSAAGNAAHRALLLGAVLGSPQEPEPAKTVCCAFNQS